MSATVGEYLRLLRLDRELSQAQIGDLSGVGQRQISRIESGAVPGVAAFFRILNALNATSSEVEEACRLASVDPRR
jgi:transcriptional regulator with XRE-family HTH domain